MYRNKPLPKICGCNGCDKPTAWNLQETITYGTPKETAVYKNAYCNDHFDVAELRLHQVTDSIEEKAAQGFQITVMLIKVK